MSRGRYFPLCPTDFIKSKQLDGLIVLAFQIRTLLCYGGALRSQWKQRRMDLWKILTAALLLSVSTQAVSGDGANPIAAAIFLTICAPTLLIGATTSLTTEPPEIFKSAKTDALAFVGSDGEIRGAEFEQASRYYRSAYASPHMSDMQLAQAISTTF